MGANSRAADGGEMDEIYGLAEEDFVKHRCQHALRRLVFVHGEGRS